jgi:hypothetical protein
MQGVLIFRTSNPLPMPRKKTGQERYYYLVCVSIKLSNNKKKHLGYRILWNIIPTSMYRPDTTFPQCLPYSV